MENAFELIKEKIVNGLANGIGEIGKSYLLGIITYAFERKDLTLKEAEKLRDMLGETFDKYLLELEKVEF